LLTQHEGKAKGENTFGQSCTDAKNKVPSAFSHKSLARQASKLSTAYQQEAEELNIDQ
jgi:hypothetical protein